MHADNSRMPKEGRGFLWLILATCLATYSLIIMGGVVRATGSGDACPDWPRCHGELIPPFETAVMIEFSHRLLASLVGILVLATAVVAWRTYRRSSFPVVGSVAALVMVIGQAILGGATVLNDLPANLVMAHLALASAILATLLVIAFSVLSWQPAGGSSREAGAFRNLALFAAVAMFGLMMTGSYVAGSGAGLAFRDWPLFDGQLLPDTGRLAVIHATHRLTAAAMALLIAYVALQAWRTQRDNKVLMGGALVALVLYIAQALVGAANVWTLLQPAAMASHLALAVALWVTLVMTAMFAHRSAEGASERPASGRSPSNRREPALGSAAATGS